MTRLIRKITVSVAAGAALLVSGVTDVRAENPCQDQSKQKQGQIDHDPSVVFESDSSLLTDEAKAELQRLASWAQTDSGNIIYLAGRSGDQIAQSAPSELSDQREEAARSFLESQGVAGEQIRSMAEAQRPMTTSPDGATAETPRIAFLMSRSELEGSAESAEHQPPGAIVHNNTYVQPADPVVIEPAPAPMMRPALLEEDGNPSNDHLLTRDGLAFRVGGGVMNFIDDGTRDVTDTGGSWEARLTYGTRSLLGAEVAYVGSAQNINALGIDGDANLLGSGGEAALRLNVPGVRYVQPYAVAGLGMTNYRVVNADFNNSNIANSENVLHVPLGAGVGVRTGNFLLDLRGTYRNTFDDAQLAASTDDVDVESSESSFDNWMATASAGVEF